MSSRIVHFNTIETEFLFNAIPLTETYGNWKQYSDLRNGLIYIKFSFPKSQPLFNSQISMHVMFMFAMLEDGWNPMVELEHGDSTRRKIWDATIWHMGNQEAFQTTNFKWKSWYYRSTYNNPTLVFVTPILTLGVIAKHWIMQMADLRISTQTFFVSVVLLTVSQRYRLKRNSFLGTHFHFFLLNDPCQKNIGLTRNTSLSNIPIFLIPGTFENDVTLGSTCRIYSHDMERGGK